MYSKKLKAVLAAFAVMVLIPIGAYAASQEDGYSYTTMNLNIDYKVVQAVEDYLQGIYGDEVSAWTENPEDSLPRRVFRYPTHQGLFEKNATREGIRKIIRDGTTNASGYVCHSLHAWYYWIDKGLEGCGWQGDVAKYPDLSIYGFDNRASSFFEDNISGNVELYDKTGYGDYIDTVLSDTAVFGSYLNDKASSAIFSL